MWCEATIFSLKLLCSGARHPIPLCCSSCAERLQWVCPCLREERQLNVCLVSSIDIFPWVQARATGGEGGNEGSVSLCVCMCESAAHGNQVSAKRLYHYLQGTKLRGIPICACVCRFTCQQRLCVIKGTSADSTACMVCFDLSLSEDFPACHTHNYTVPLYAHSHSKRLNHRAQRLIREVTWLLSNTDFIQCRTMLRDRNFLAAFNLVSQCIRRGHCRNIIFQICSQL